jgi:hypothetical protein
MKKDEKNIDKKKQINMNEYIEMMKKFMQSQIEMNKYRIKQFKEWSELDCDCEVDENQVLISDDKSSFPKEFKEEWA